MRTCSGRTVISCKVHNNNYGSRFSWWCACHLSNFRKSTDCSRCQQQSQSGSAADADAG